VVKKLLDRRGSFFLPALLTEGIIPALAPEIGVVGGEAV